MVEKPESDKLDRIQTDDLHYVKTHNKARAPALSLSSKYKEWSFNYV